MAGSIRDHFEINLFQVNNAAGTCTAVPGVTAVANVLFSGNQDTPSTWIPNLTLTCANANDGTAPANSATLVNRFGFPIAGAHVRFVMPKGAVYAVSEGAIRQAFDGDAVHVVDVNVDLDAESTTTVSI